MTYKYTAISPSGSSFRTIVIDNFQEMVEEQFSLSSSSFTIQEETSFGSGVLQNVTVRLNTAISSVTGIKMGDDFKKIIFSDVDHSVYVGSKFYFENNYWLAVNTETKDDLVSSATIRRCNNVLRWADENFTLYQCPCVIDYPLKRPSDSKSTINPLVPEGFINIFAQQNTKTSKLKANQRFLFGNATNGWICYKIFGGGIKNYINEETSDNDTSRLLFMSVGMDFVNEDEDNLTLGIADYYKNVFAFDVSPASINGGINDTFQIIPNLTINDVATTKDMAYTTSSSSIATVSGSGGLVTLIAAGSATITVSLDDNTDVNTDVSVVVSASTIGTYDIRVDPAELRIFEDETATFTVYNYFNGVVQSGSFVFTIANNNIPTANYTFSTIDGNSFSVKNDEMYLDDPLSIVATSGSNIKTINLMLRGAW